MGSRMPALSPVHAPQSGTNLQIQHKQPFEAPAMSTPGPWQAVYHGVSKTQLQED